MTPIHTYRIRPLVWRAIVGHPTERFAARSVIGEFVGGERKDMPGFFYIDMPGTACSVYCQTEEECKAKAESLYLDRLMPALERFR